jgi:hypothetical protein
VAVKSEGEAVHVLKGKMKWGGGCSEQEECHGESSKAELSGINISGIAE